jgi:transcriptional regulator with XRE-family HTH domain
MTKMPMKKLIGSVIKHNREQCGFSLKVLAEKTNLSPSYISQIENGKVSPSLSTLVKIADILGTTIQGLFEEVFHQDENPVIRKGDRRLASSLDEGIKISFATNSVLSKIMEVAVVKLQVGAQTGDNASSYKRFGSQVMYVTKGKVEARLKDNTYILEKGDSLNMNSDDPHSVRNIHTNVSEVIFFVVPHH